MAVEFNAAASDVVMRPKGITTTTAIVGKDASQMGMDDFFNLLVAQMTNQDMLNPQTDTDYIAQMAQFTTLQGIKTIQEYQLSSYASSYVGKAVSIAYENDTTGKLEKIEGVVEAVTFYDGAPKVVVNGTAYDLHTVMEVLNGMDNRVSLNEASGYIGKTVTVGYEDEDGIARTRTGVVTSVSVSGNEPCIIIDGKLYRVKDIIGVVGDPEEPAAPVDPENEPDTDE